MERLRIIDNLRVIEERRGVAFSGALVCDCKNESFYLTHTGRQTRGILSPYLAKKKGQLRVKCCCTKCGREITVYDSTLDGLKPKPCEKGEFSDLVIKSTRAFGVVMSYNYYEEDYLTDRFVECFISLSDEGGKSYEII